jgi:hypothetical protein
VSEVLLLVAGIVALAAGRVAWALAFDPEFIRLWERARDDYFRQKAERKARALPSSPMEPTK